MPGECRHHLPPQVPPASLGGDGRQSLASCLRHDNVNKVGAVQCSWDGCWTSTSITASACVSVQSGVHVLPLMVPGVPHRAPTCVRRTASAPGDVTAGTESNVCVVIGADGRMGFHRSDVSVSGDVLLRRRSLSSTRLCLSVS